MNFCKPHWDELRAAVTAAGLNDFVSSDGKEAMGRLVDQIKGEPDTRRNVDPLLACSQSILSRAIHCGGLKMLMPDEETGKPPCPVCEAKKHTQDDWIAWTVKCCREYMQTLPP